MKSLLLQGRQTERLIFRKLHLDDFETWLPFHQNPLSTRYWNGLPTDPMIACQEQFDRVFERYQKGLGGMNALIEKSSKTLIGMCGLLVQTVDGVEELEIGYSILPKYWKNGYATEAAVRCRDYAFENNLSESLISIIHVNNLPSQKVALKVGMHLKKTTSYKSNPVHIYQVDAE